MKISFAWWNTALSPTKKQNRASGVDRKLSMGVIAHFVLEKKIDLLGLCEVSQDDVKELAAYCHEKGYGVIDGVRKEGRAIFDCCVIYKMSALKFIAEKVVLGRYSRRKLKIANHMLFSVGDTDEKMHFFFSHWPSVAMVNQGTPLRLEYASFLRDAIDEIWDADPKALIVLMGDYNDEPFDFPLSFKLRATRDAHLIRDTDGALYNPFWRRIGCIRGYDRAVSDLTYAGTYFYRRDTVDRWRTYDQMIFSSAFLGASSWHLNEKSVGVVDIPEYTKQVLSAKSIFDHLPITATVERDMP